MKYLKILLAALLSMFLLASLGGCATSKNTASTRFIKSFKSRYNTYFNGHQAYLQGMRAKADGCRDNYLSPLPLLMAGNENMKDLGKSDFETAITKCEKTIQLHSIKRKPELKRGHKQTPAEKAFRERSEFNPFLHNAWYLMGESQMQKGDFLEASSTFSYMARLYRTQAVERSRARSMQALCYTELGWYYDAEQVLDKVSRDGVPKGAQRDYNRSMADLHLRQKHWAEALPYLQKEIKTLPHGVRKARAYYLLSQVYRELGKKPEAYKALAHCKGQSPSYEMKFNAEVAQTEVMPQGNDRKRISKLKAMARKPENKDYLSRVYYAMGNVYMANKDTARAIETYEKGAASQGKNSAAKGMLNLALGDIYWARERFSDALRCYKASTSTLRHNNERLQEVRWRAAMLGSLTKHTDVIFTEDSVQTLAKMDEKDRNAVIDKAIALAKERLKQEKKAEAAQNATARGTIRPNTPAAANSQPNAVPQAAGGAWYFYDDNTVRSGAELFKKQWGNRPNEDMWRLSKKATASSPSANASAGGKDGANGTGGNADADANGTDGSGKGSKKKGKEQEDDPESPLSRSYYLAQLPMTPELLDASNGRLRDALYGAALVAQNEMGDYRLAGKYFSRLMRDFPVFKQNESVYYQMFLLESQQGSRDEAARFRSLLVDSFPDGKLTKIVTDPYFEEKARYGVQMEDSLYAETYNAYCNNDYSLMQRNCSISAAKYPEGLNRAKFMYMEAMLQLAQGQVGDFSRNIRELVSKYSEDPVAKVAEAISKGLKEGRRPVGGSYNVQDLWGNRSSMAAETEMATAADTLSPDRHVPYTFIVAYQPDSLDEGRLLYHLSRFNFTRFSLRNFEIEHYKTERGDQYRVHGFANYDEVHSYVEELYKDSAFKASAAAAEPIIVSDRNLELLVARYTMDEYLQFYKKYYLPVSARKPDNLDSDPSKFIWDEFEEVQQPADDDSQNGDVPVDDDDSQWY